MSGRLLEIAHDFLHVGQRGFDLRHDAAKLFGHRGIAQDLPDHALAFFQALGDLVQMRQELLQIAFRLAQVRREVRIFLHRLPQLLDRRQRRIAKLLHEILDGLHDFHVFETDQRLVLGQFRSGSLRDLNVGIARDAEFLSDDRLRVGAHEPDELAAHADPPAMLPSSATVISSTAPTRVPRM